mgnify:CR=1 FL=1
MQQNIFDQMEENGEFERKAEEILRNGLGESGGDLKAFLKTEAGAMVAKALGFDTSSGANL